jgi:integrase
MRVNKISLEQDKILEGFDSYLDRTRIQQSTKKMYVWCMSFYMKNNYDLESIEDYNNVLISHSVKKRSNVFYSAFKKFINFYVEDAGKKRKMVRALIFPKINDPKRFRKFLDFRERKKIINSLKKEKHKLIAEIQLFTGARVREILKLEKGDIMYDEYNKECAMILNITQKGGQKKPIWILDKELEEKIDAYTLSDWNDWKYYFIERSNSHDGADDTTLLQTNYVWYWRDIKDAIKSMGYEYKDWATHDFRRGLGTDVWSATKDPISVQRALRHKRFDTTLRYLGNAGMQTQELFSNLAKVYNQK